MPLDIIENRSSVRNFSQTPVPNEKIKEVLEAARLAPSWANVQPWHFIVIKDPITKQLMHELSHNQPHVQAAPIIIACCWDIKAWEKRNFKPIMLSRPGITEERVDELLENPAFNPILKGADAVTYRTIEELTYAIAYMTIEAENQGLGACIVGFIGNDLTESMLETYEEVKDRLALPDNIVLVSLLLLGYPSDDAKKHSKIRKPLEKIVSYERYDIKN
ncbi:MAG: nitroreductase family protein [Desulfomicrobium escambiense]|nr:nitroreductase family protein [Desulfomicrobium escambiense]